MTVDFDSGLPTFGPLFIRTSVCICVVAAMLVLYRFWSTYDRRGFFGLEEGMVLASLIFLSVITGIGIEACVNGFGYHKADIQTVGGDLHRSLQYFFLFQIFYKMTICFNKLAFLTLYLRIFPAKSTRLHISAAIGFVVAGTTAFVIATITECIPVEKNWNRKLEGHCINNTAFRWSWAGFNTLTDLWVVILPLPILWQLQMSLLKRIGAMFIFSLGLFVVATSCLRMKALVKSVSNPDTTWDSASAFIWSDVEAAVGLIATCLPSLKAPLARLLPSKIAGSSNRTKTRSAFKLGRMLGKNSRRTFSEMKSDGTFSNTKPFGGGENDTVYITATAGKDDDNESRESQDRILKLPHGITVQRDISVRSTTVDGPHRS